MEEKNKVLIPEEAIMSIIYLIRGQKVMLDRDLANLFDVETKRLKEAIRRNISRFPEDFMFELSQEEFREWRSQFLQSEADKIGLRYPPFAFTEHGVLMLASVLASERAIQVNILIVRIFAKMREMLLAHKDLFERIRQIEQKYNDYDEKILLIFEYLRQLEQSRQQQEEQVNRKRIGFRPDV